MLMQRWRYQDVRVLWDKQFENSSKNILLRHNQSVTVSLEGVSCGSFAPVWVDAPNEVCTFSISVETVKIAAFVN